MTREYLHQWMLIFGAVFGLTSLGCAQTVQCDRNIRWGHGACPTQLDDSVASYVLQDKTIFEFMLGEGSPHEGLNSGLILYDHPDILPKSHPKITVRLASTTVRGVFDALTAADTSYYWIPDGRVVVLVPKTRKAGNVDVVAKLEERIPRFQVERETMLGAVTQLMRQARQQGLTGFPDLPVRPIKPSPEEEEGWIFVDEGKVISLSLRNTSIRNCLNAIVEREWGGSWIAYPISDGQIGLGGDSGHSHKLKRAPMTQEGRAQVKVLAHEIEALTAKEELKPLTPKEKELLEAKRKELIGWRRKYNFTP